MADVTRLRRFPYPAALVLTVVSVLTLVPMYWMVSSSLKSSAELAEIPVTLWPRSLVPDQYEKLFSQSPIGRAAGESLLVALSTTAIVVIFGSGASYAVSHLRLRASKHLLGLTLVTQFLPQAATLVPIFTVWSQLGLTNRLSGVTIVYVLFQLPVAVWILTGYFASIPGEVIEAAQVDGSGSVGTLVRIVIPMAAPGVAAVSIWCVIGCWSELLFALILLNGESQTVPVTLSGLVGQHTTDAGLLMAGATIAALPPLVLFFVVQKYLANGLSGAVKG